MYSFHINQIFIPRIKTSVEKGLDVLNETSENNFIEKEELANSIHKEIKFKIIDDDDFYKPPTENRVIVLVPINETVLRNNILTVIRPVVDRYGKLLTGQPQFSDEEKKKVVKVVDEFTERKLVGKVRLDLDNPYDAIDWAWMKFHPYIAATREQAESNQKARYYVEDKEKENRNFVSRKKHESNLINIISELSFGEKIQLARVMDLLTMGVSESDIDKFLFEMATKDFDVVSEKQMLTLLSDKNKLKFLYLAKTLIDKGDIAYEFSSYKYKGNIIGTSFEEYIAWLNRPEQNDFVALKINAYLK